MRPAARQKIRLSGGTELAFVTAGDRNRPALLLLHGFPGSADYFRGILPALTQAAFLIAPDLPGYGASEPLPSPTFSGFAEAVSELLDRLGVGPRFIYLHDFGAPPAFQIAMESPDLVLGLIVQNANAHLTGLGPQWKPVFDYWTHPDSDNEAAATAHLTLEGVRNGYLGGMPPDVAARIPAEIWEEDWRVMQLPGRMETQRAQVRDYANHVARFGEIAHYLARRQPPALMIWARHDPFFDLAEVQTWMEALPRMEAHILDGGHKLLETHSAAAAPLMREFIRQTMTRAPIRETKEREREPAMSDA